MEQTRFMRFESEDNIISQKVIPYLRSLGYLNIKTQVMLLAHGQHYRVDTVVYENQDAETPYAVVEVRREVAPEISILDSAVQQAYSYSALLTQTKYLLITDGMFFHWFEVDLASKTITPIPAGPEQGIKKIAIESSVRIDSAQFYELLSKLLFEVLQSERGRGTADFLRLALDLHKILAAKLFDERNTSPGNTPRFRFAEVEQAADRVKDLYRDLANSLEPHFPQSEWLLSDQGIVAAVSILEPYSLAQIPTSVLSRIFWEVYVPFFGMQKSRIPATPLPLAKLLVTLANPKPSERILDPACGAGLLPIEALEQVRTQLGPEVTEISFHTSKVNIFGIDVLPLLTEFARLNFLFANLNPNQIITGDSFKISLEQAHCEAYDVILLDPPIGHIIVPPGSKVFFSSSRPRLEELFIELSLNLLKPGGRLAVLIPENVLFAQPSMPLRRFIQENAAIKMILSLPVEAFAPAGHSGKASILLLEKKGESIVNDQGIVFVDILNIGYDRSGKIIDNDAYGKVLSVADSLHSVSPASLSGPDLKMWTIPSSKLDIHHWDVASNNPTRDDVRDLLSRSPYPQVRLNKISKVIGGRALKRSGSSEAYAVMIPAGAVREMELDLSAAPSINEEEFHRLEAAQVFIDDVLITTTGQYLGRAAVQDLDGLFVASNNITILRVKKEVVDPYFLAMYMNSELARSQIDDIRASGTVIPFIRRADLGNISLPLPDLAIQQNLSKKIRQILGTARSKRIEAAQLETDARKLITQKLLGGNQENG